MKQPKIKVYSFNHKDSSHFTLYTINREEGLEFFKDRADGLTEKVIYEGLLPEKMRILPKVDTKFLKGYMQFKSQYIPSEYRNDKTMIGVATAIRGTCWGSIYDREIYNDDGLIVSSMMDQNLPENVKKYITMFLSESDIARIEEYEKTMYD